ncbi:hypothetical protein RB2150_11206 [Rhodobacteraceae bacterium HTCC2150]|nr:hypothetical protein RB2150_11206 [Rhodobacteraceae bacterium HTCC2150]
MATTDKLAVDTTLSAMEMADMIFGNGVKVETASYTGADSASGGYTGGDTTAGDLTPSDSGLIFSTGNAADVTQSSGNTNQSAGTSTNHDGDGNDALSDIAGMTTYDAAILSAEFIPVGDTLTMQIVFSSEEYLEYVNSGYNDAVGIFVNGVKAELSVGDGTISIDNINNETNENLYIDNPAGDNLVNTEMDGLTVTMTLKAPVNPGETNTISIGIADAGDGSYDSNLLIAADSVQTELIAVDDAITGGFDTKVTLDIVSNDEAAASAELHITHINGQAVNPGDTVTLNSGEVVTLNDDGTISIQAGSTETTSTFTYQVADDLGNTDLGNVTHTTVACFVAGSLITTPLGPIPIENLNVGDRVVTLDGGIQKICWIGSSRPIAKGRDAPIHFSANAIGNHHAVTFSQNHRVLIRDALAELLFGTTEVLVKAKDLVNDHSIRRIESDEPTHYVHMMFDQHEIVFANGMPSESYHPGPQTLPGFDAETQAEILRLMPNAADEIDYGYGPAARAVLKKHECAVLRQYIELRQTSHTAPNKNTLH